MKESEKKVKIEKVENESTEGKWNRKDWDSEEMIQMMKFVS